MNYCYGRECKLGWGYNEPMNRLVPVDEEPLNVTSEINNVFKHFDFQSPLTSMDNVSSSILITFISNI